MKFLNWVRRLIVTTKTDKYCVLFLHPTNFLSVSKRDLANVNLKFSGLEKYAITRAASVWETHEKGCYFVQQFFLFKSSTFIYTHLLDELNKQFRRIPGL